MPKVALDVSVGLATSVESPEHIRIAEQVGYRRAWCYDSPALYPDVWMVLGLAADRTERIGLGPAVLVPGLRHPITNAAAAAGLAALAPGRVAVAVGTGFTGRLVLGQKPLTWAATRSYIEAVQALLAGQRVKWDGGVCQLIHPPGFSAAGGGTSVDVPVLVAAAGPKGTEIAREIGDGLFLTFAAQAQSGWDWQPSLGFGTVLADDGAISDEVLLDRAGPGAAVLYHGIYDRAGGAEAVASLPGGDTWRESVEAAEPAETRHLAVHLVHLTDQDRKALTPEFVRSVTFTGTADDLRHRLDQFAGAGLTEFVYQPCGADIPGELERFATMAGLS